LIFFYCPCFKFGRAYKCIFRKFLVYIWSDFSALLHAYFSFLLVHIFTSPVNLYSQQFKKAKLINWLKKIMINMLTVIQEHYCLLLLHHMPIMGKFFETLEVLCFNKFKNIALILKYLFLYKNIIILPMPRVPQHLAYFVIII